MSLPRWEGCTLAAPQRNHPLFHREDEESAELPALFFSVSPMRRGRWRWGLRAESMFVEKRGCREGSQQVDDPNFLVAVTAAVTQPTSPLFLLMRRGRRRVEGCLQ
ncbi:unnamed protein product [Musa acuminata var. zebrina]